MFVVVVIAPPELGTRKSGGKSPRKSDLLEWDPMKTGWGPLNGLPAAICVLSSARIGTGSVEYYTGKSRRIWICVAHIASSESWLDVNNHCSIREKD